MCVCVCIKIFDLFGVAKGEAFKIALQTIVCIKLFLKYSSMIMIMLVSVVVCAEINGK